MNKLLIAALPATLLLAAPASAGAFPMAPAAPTVQNGADIIQVAEGCGPGRFRNRFGYCRPFPRRPGVAIVVPGVRIGAPWHHRWHHRWHHW